MLYIVVFIDLPTTQMALFYVAIAVCNLLLFVITNQCAVIVNKFNIFERLTRSFIFEYFFEPKQKYKHVKLQWVKLDFFQGNKRLHRYAFKIFAYYRITSKTYYMVRNKKQNNYLIFFIN